MPTPTYTPLATLTLSSSASTVTFGSIPNTYKDLVLVIAGTASAADQLVCRFNSSTSNYSEVAMLGYSGGAISYTATANRLSQMALSTSQSVATMQIMDYSATDKHKTALYRTSLGGASTYAVAGRWGDTSAITSIYLGLESAGVTFSSGTVFSLYGVAG